jgi:CRP-like cAMP-binding protein
MVHPQEHPLVSKLGSIAKLSHDDKAALRNLPLHVQTLRADQDIVRDGDRVSRSCLLLEGFACRNKFTGDGKRQIMSFHIPGEIPDLQSVHLTRMDHNLQTLTACQVGFIRHEELLAVCEKYPRLAAAFWRETLIDAAIFREWVVNVGRRDAIARMAHVFCEFFFRMRMLGLTTDHTCEFPISQVEFADALGLSTVHTNRTLQELRSQGLIALKGKTLTVKDWEGLKKVGDFDPAYLHERSEEADA